MTNYPTAKEMADAKKALPTDELFENMKKFVSSGQYTAFISDEQEKLLLSLGYTIRKSVLYEGEKIISWQN